jgi:hypothetical protein
VRAAVAHGVIAIIDAENPDAATGDFDDFPAARCEFVDITNRVPGHA